jgi:hypothetical protein
MEYANRQQPLYYLVLVKGHLKQSWGSWFDGMNIAYVINNKNSGLSDVFTV